MYPAWINSMFDNTACPECRSAITLDNIDAIAAGRPDDCLAHLRDPMALVIVTCPHCKGKLHLSMRCPKEVLMNAIEEFVRRIESAPAPAGDPPPFGPGSTPTPHPETSADGGARAGDQPAVRPSVRDGQTLDPPSEAEVKAFLGRLRRMSFRRGSKSFRKFTDHHPRDDRDDPKPGKA